MATDIFCSLRCVYKLPSGLCGASGIGLGERAGGLTCNRLEEEITEEEMASVGEEARSGCEYGTYSSGENRIF